MPSLRKSLDTCADAAAITVGAAVGLWLAWLIFKTLEHIGVVITKVQWT